jgi:hypothetical protein
MISPKRAFRFPRLLAAATVTAAVGLLPLSLGACADAGAQFDVKYAPGFQRGASTVSILGVFREGRMSPETWEDIGPKIAPVFARDTCSIGFDTRLLSDKPSLAESIDDYTRENGVTDDLLDQLAPGASGDNVLVITVAGRPNEIGKPDAGAGAPTGTPQAQQRGMGRRGGPGGMGSSTPMRVMPIDRNAFEMSASLFSLREHKTVAVVTMGYAGTSGAEALQIFVRKLRESFGGAPCVGWHMADAAIDEKKIKEMTHE